MSTHVTALTAQTAGGFLLTTATIQCLPLAVDAFGWRGAMPLLGIGPVLGAVAMTRLLAPKPAKMVAR